MKGFRIIANEHTYQFVIAFTLVIGIIVCYLATGKIPDVMTFCIAAIIGYYFGVNNSKPKEPQP